VTYRLLYLIFVRLCGWLVLPPRSDDLKNTEMLVRRSHSIGDHRNVQRTPRSSQAELSSVTSPCGSVPTADAQKEERRSDDGRTILECAQTGLKSGSDLVLLVRLTPADGNLLLNLPLQMIIRRPT
jgi:hypothetical protein